MSMSMEWVPKRKDLGISCFQTFLFVIEVILPGLCAYVLATIQVSDAFLVSRLVSGAGVSSGLPCLFFSFSFVHVLVDALLTQIYSTMLVISFARLYRTGVFRGRARARAKAILASVSLRKRPVPVTFSFFLKAVVTVGAYVAVIPSAFRLLDVLGERELLFVLLGGGAAFLAATVFNAAFFHRVCAVPVLKDASGIRFGVTMRRRLALVGSGNFYAGAAALALLDGLCVVPVAVLAAASSSKLLAFGTASTAVQCTVMMVMQVTQPAVYLVLWDNHHSF